MPSLADLNLRHLRAVPVIVEHGGISAASPVVHLSQPAVTQGLAKLEAQLGHRLFDRAPGGMAATPAGRLLAGRIEAAFAHITAAVRAVRRAGSGGPQRPDLLISAAQVRALLAFAAHGGYAAAAQATGHAQPSLHRAIGDLEALCGVELVERRGRGVALSPAGRRMVRGFRLAAAELAAGLSDLAGAEGAASGRVSVGALPASRARVIPKAVAQFHREHPAVSVTIFDGPYPEMMERLRDGEIDLVIGALRTPAPGPDVDQRPLFQDELLIVGRRGHPLAGSASPSLADTARYPWIIAREGAPMRAQWEALFRSQGLSPAAAVECGSVGAIRGMLLEGDYLALLSPHQFELDGAAGLLVQIGASLSETRRTIGLTTRTGWIPSAVQASFLAALGRAAAPEIE